MNLDDTIVAMATPAGRGGIGVVRLAGGEARRIASGMLRGKRDWTAGAARLAELVDSEAGERIDEVVVTYFAKPHSYTTDDIVEIAAHGSPVIMRHMVELAIKAGARLAQPGEFTMRAFLNGRIDLTQAEAVRDLIESQTLHQAKVAAQQMQGALSHRLQPIKLKLVELIATMEAGIDFAEDDVAVMGDKDIVARIEAVREPLRRLEASFAYGRVVHEGLTLAIVGRPNVGKSSLFNRLAERERAIVTATPGTTRDLVTETVAVGGIPLKLVDTAGIRAAADEAESIGIKKSYEALADADMVVLVMDATLESDDGGDAALLAEVEGRGGIVVENKADLAGGKRANGGRLRTSAVTGEGMEALRAEILRRTGGDANQQESGFLTNARHQGLVREAIAGLDATEKAVMEKIPHEMVTMDLYSALRPLDAITGETTGEDILTIIFSRFCIGK